MAAVPASFAWTSGHTVTVGMVPPWYSRPLTCLRPSSSSSTALTGQLALSNCPSERTGMMTARATIPLLLMTAVWQRNTLLMRKARSRRPLLMITVHSRRPPLRNPVPTRKVRQWIARLTTIVPWRRPLLTLTIRLRTPLLTRKAAWWSQASTSVTARTLVTLRLPTTATAVTAQLGVLRTPARPPIPASVVIGLFGRALTAGSHLSLTPLDRRVTTPWMSSRAQLVSTRMMARFTTTSAAYTHTLEAHGSASKHPPTAM
mmetsp:Transcript_10320/g.41997  ORF Transcript_10320/g.41997 Transcript_10320/m.41997 type:complete len:260 (-) Transcript_10320:245-1024(-)